MIEHETQDSISQWIDASFPAATMRRRLKHLLEEVTELTVASGTDLTLADAIAVLTHAWVKAQSQTGQSVASEIADARISLTGIASAQGICEQDALNEKMTENRQRSLAERQQREADKQALPVYSP
jgi:hypothetical protein